MITHISDIIGSMKSSEEKSRKFSESPIDLDNPLNDFDLDTKLPDGKLRVVYSKQENLMIIELESEGKKNYYFYLVDESERLKFKGGWVGMALLAYGEKYWREIQKAKLVSVDWGDKISEEIFKIKNNLP